MSQNVTEVAQQLKSLTTDEKATAIRDAVTNLSAEEKSKVAKALATVLPLPSGPTNDTIWLIIISAFAITMVGSVLVLGIGVFQKADDLKNQITKSDTILTVFTTVVGFLAGLLSPSPLGNKSQ